MRPNSDALVVVDAFSSSLGPGRFAFERPEGDRQNGRIRHGPARGLHVDPPRAGPRSGPIGQPQDGSAVGPLQRAGQEQAHAGTLEQGQQGAAPARRLVGTGGIECVTWLVVGETGKVVHFLDTSSVR